MGRSISNSLYIETTKPWYGKFAERPIWALWSCAAGSTSSYVYLFGRNPHVVIGAVDMSSDVFSTSGTTAAVRQGASGEIANAGWYPAGHTSTQVSSQGWSPSSGQIGISCNSQTTSYFNTSGFQNGNFAYEYTANQQAQIQQYACTMVMNEFDQQDFDIVFNTSNQIQVFPIGATHLSEAAWGGTLVGSLTGIVDDTGHMATRPIVSWNRKTNTIAMMYHSADSATNTKKIHIFKMLPDFNVNQFSTGKSIELALAASKVAGRYSFFTVSLPTWHNITSNAARHGGKLILCDDDSLWFGAESPTNGGNADMKLYSIVRSGASYTATQLDAMTCSKIYNSDNSAYYAIKHLNSDDNKYIAVFSHYYYYLGGCNLWILPVQTADGTVVASRYQDAATSAASRTIAPCGGSDFVICNSSYNSDSYGPYISFLRPGDQGTGAVGTLNLRDTGQGVWPSITTSTNYQGNFVMKVQPTTPSK